MTFSGVYMKYWNFGTWGLNGGWHDKDYFFDLNEEKKITTIAGYCGCAYPANIFTDTQDYINFIKELSKNHKNLTFNDDVLISAYLSKLNIEKIRIPIKNNTIGESCKEDGEEVLSPDPLELYDTIYSLKDYFIKNNPKKYTLVFLDIVIFIFFILIFLVSYKVFLSPKK